MREKCPYSELFWSGFSRIRTEYRHILLYASGLNMEKSNKYFECEKCPNTEFFLSRIFSYSVPMWENTDQKTLCFWTLFTQCKYIFIE